MNEQRRDVNDTLRSGVESVAGAGAAVDAVKRV